MTHPRFWRDLSGAVAALCLLGLGSGCGAQSHAASEATNPAQSPSDSSAEPQLLALADKTTDGKAGKPAAASAVGGATLRGRVVFDGPPPKRRVINMTKDKECIKLHGEKQVLDESVIVGSDGAVQNAFVYIRRGAPKADYPIPPEPIALVQENCMYRPRVQGMLTGQTLSVLNGDPLTHNVRSFPIRNKAFNFGQPAKSEPRERVFASPEREIEIQCDIHPWMHAYLFVMDHPFFAVSEADGTFAIAGLPPGKYTLAVWHEVLGKQDLDVTVAAQDQGDVDFHLKP